MSMNTTKYNIEEPCPSTDLYEELIDSCDSNCEYLDITSSSLPLSDTSIDSKYCALQINIHSLPSKFDQLKEMLSTLKEINIDVHFILLCETFISDKVKTIYNIEGYDMVSHERKKGKGGGLAIYVHKDFSFNLREDLEVNINQEFESLFIEVNKCGKKLIIGEIYRVPNTSEKLSLERYKMVMDNLKSYNGDVIIGTDQNFDLLKYHVNNNVKLLLNIFIEEGFMPTITKPTRVTHASATVIDNIYVKGKLCYKLNSFIIETDISDHYPILTFMGNKEHKKAHGEPIQIQYRYINSESCTKINDFLFNKDWSILHNGSINEAYAYFSDNLINCLNEYAPKKTKIITSKQFEREPWVTKGILISIKTKAKLYRKCKQKDKSHPTYKAYTLYSKILNKVKRKAKNSHINSILKENFRNMKKTWQIINTLMGKESDKTTITMLKVNGVQITNPKVITETFAEYFAHVGKVQSQNIATTNIKSYKYCTLNSDKSIYLIPTDMYEIVDIITKMKASKSKGHDDITSNLLKELKYSIALPLSILINRTLNEGIFPEALKIAKVIPLYKSKSRDIVSNYRPISILSNISKIYEKVIHKRLYAYLNSNLYLDPLQFGFKPKHSTVQAVTKLTQDILYGFENRKYTLAVYCDLSKAFDTLDHSILLDKLSRYGIRGTALNLFKTYLEDRSLYVNHNNISSDMQLMPNFGVPQGSVLGPLLFIIYINDLRNSLKYSSHILYADDTTLYLIGNNLKELFSKMNEELHLLSTWFKVNKLSLNLEKTNYVVFSSKYIDISKHKLVIDDVVLRETKLVKFLGIYMDNHLIWEHHIKYIENKVSVGLYNLNILKHILPSYNLKMIYLSFVHSHINYGCLLWGNTYKKHLKKLKICQKKAIRIASHKKYDSPSSPLFKAMNVLNIEDTFKYQIGQFMYKCSYFLVPASLNSNYMKNNEVHQYHTRHSKDYVIPHYKNSIVLNSFLTQGPKLWFDLPYDMKQKSYTEYCNVLKAKLLSKY